MKPFGILLAVVAVGGIFFWMSNDSVEEREPVQAPPPAPQEVAEGEPVEMALPPEMDDLEVEEVVSEEIVDAEPQGDGSGKLTKPRVIGRTRLPDGRIEVRILSPVHYGNGEQKNLVRVLRASPRQMKSDLVMQKVPWGKRGERPAQPAPEGGERIKKK